MVSFCNCHQAVQQMESQKITVVVEEWVRHALQLPAQHSSPRVLRAIKSWIKIASVALDHSPRMCAANQVMVHNALPPVVLNSFQAVQVLIESAKD